MSISDKFNPDEILGFWHETDKDLGFLSNFYSCQFECKTKGFLPDSLLEEFGDKLVFNCSEQYFMVGKAVLFFDGNQEVNTHLIHEIMSEENPKKIKKCGRKVKGFNEAKWNKVKFNLMMTANRLKYTQNKDLAKRLTDTGDKYLVEASPFDGVWGIKMKRTHPDFLYPGKWKGENLLGQVLMKLRKEF